MQHTEEVDMVRNEAHVKLLACYKQLVSEEALQKRVRELETIADEYGAYQKAVEKKLREFYNAEQTQAQKRVSDFTNVLHQFDSVLASHVELANKVDEMSKSFERTPKKKEKVENDRCQELELEVATLQNELEQLAINHHGTSSFSAYIHTYIALEKLEMFANENQDRVNELLEQNNLLSVKLNEDSLKLKKTTEESNELASELERTQIRIVQLTKEKDSFIAKLKSLQLLREKENLTRESEITKMNESYLSTCEGIAALHAVTCDIRSKFNLAHEETAEQINQIHGLICIFNAVVDKISREAARLKQQIFEERQRTDVLQKKNDSLEAEGDLLREKISVLEANIGRERLTASNEISLQSKKYDQEVALLQKGRSRLEKELNEQVKKVERDNEKFQVERQNLISSHEIKLIGIQDQLKCLRMEGIEFIYFAQVNVNLCTSQILMHTRALLIPSFLPFSRMYEKESNFEINE
ncbi:hypothetical protein Ciccas_007694 [Cichlidogyrus casuarinus]|uniref:Uncharacterized protein n=1 Tax=Cichlidogyrus casuarinus TaxID=1844966 RepID=A0ABD2Q2I8_9PLAT